MKGRFRNLVLLAVLCSSISLVCGQKSPLLRMKVVHPNVSLLGTPDTFLLGAPVSTNTTFFNVRQYGVQNGLFTVAPKELQMDALNRLWFINFTAGLGCIDGRKVLRYSVPQGLGDRFDRLNIMSNGDTWVGSNGYGLFKIAQGRIYHYDIEQLPDVHMGPTKENPDGSVWTTTTFAGLIRIHGDTIWTIPDTLGYQTVGRPRVLEEASGTIWTLSQKGLQVIDGNTVHFIEEVKVRNTGKEILKDAKGNIWVATDIHLWFFEGGDFRKPVKVDYGGEENPNGILEDEEGNIWVKTWNNLYFGNIGRFRWLPSHAFVGKKSHVAGLVVRDKQIFVCMDNSIAFIHDRRFSIPNEVLQAERLIPHQDHKGNVWLNAHKDDAPYTQVAYNSDMELLMQCHDPKMLRMAVDRKGKRWAVREGLEFGYYDSCTFVRTHKMLSSERGVQQIVEIRDDIWVLGYDNLHLYREDKFQGHFPGSARYLKEGPGELIYAIINKRLARFENGRWHDMDYLLPDPRYHTNRIVAPKGQDRLFAATWGAGIWEVKGDTLIQCKDSITAHITRQVWNGSGSRVWICGQGTGLTLYNGEKFVAVGDMGHRIPNDCWYVTEDSKSRIWLGTNDGYYRLDPWDKNDLKINTPEDIIKKYKVKRIGQQIRLMSLNGKMVEKNRFVDCLKGDYVWLATRHGAIYSNINQEVHDGSPSSIYLERIKINRSTVPRWDSLPQGISCTGVQGEFNTPEGLVLDYTHNNIGFEFGGLDWYKLEDLKFMSYLEGLEEKWNQPTTLNFAEYSSLPSGDYTLHVRTINAGGLLSKEVTFSFSVKAPFWQTWWFIGLLVIGGVLIIYMLIRARTRALIAKKEELEQIVEERTVELRAEKELVEEKNKEIIDSINYAKRLQDAIIPSDEEFASAFPDAFVLYRPKDIVAGDFYWMHRQDDLTLFAVADCTGHGVPGAIVSVVCSNALNRTVEEFGITEPGKILDRSRELIQSSFETSNAEVKDGMDVCLIAFNHKTGEVSYAGANNPLWLYNPGTGELTEYKATKQPVGYVDAPKPFESHSLTPQKGEVLYMFSDGYADQFGGERGKKFKSSNMKKLLAEICNLPIEQQLQRVTKQFDDWKGSLEQLDDVCVVGIRF